MNQKINWNRNQIDTVQYIPLVQKIVDTSFVNYNGPFERDELVNIGTIGLMDAIEKFDDSQNAKFETYATWRIKGAIYDELRKAGKISRHRMDKVNNLYKTIEVLQHDFLREPTEKEIMKHMDVTRSELDNIYGAIHFLSSYSLEKTIYGDGDQEYSISDMIEDTSLLTPDDAFVEEERREVLALAIDDLKERERVLLNLIYFEELPVKSIAEILGITSSRVSQLHGKILARLRVLTKDYLELR